MLPSFLITFREVIEATLIVATILGILTKLKESRGTRIVWTAAITAFAASGLLLVAGSILGMSVQQWYTGKTESYIEGYLLIVSAIFITWAVFFLHRYFGSYKTHLLQKLRDTVVLEEKSGLFILVFTAVFREGIEIVLFLSTLYFSSNPTEILGGFTLGAISAFFLSAGIFRATIRLPIFWAFRTTSILLILFAGGMITRGVHELMEVGMIPEITSLSLWFIPTQTSVFGSILKSIFGITREMNILQLSAYAAYVGSMFWYAFGKKQLPPQASQPSA